MPLTRKFIWDVEVTLRANSAELHAETVHIHTRTVGFWFFKRTYTSILFKGPTFSQVITSDLSHGHEKVFNVMNQNYGELKLGPEASRMNIKLERELTERRANALLGVIKRSTSVEELEMSLLEFLGTAR